MRLARWEKILILFSPIIGSMVVLFDRWQRRDRQKVPCRERRGGQTKPRQLPTYKPNLRRWAALINCG